MAGLTVSVVPGDIAKVIVERRPIRYRPSYPPVCVVELVPAIPTGPGPAPGFVGVILRWSAGDSRQPRYESYDGPSRICGSVLVPCSAVRLCSGGTSGTGWRLWSAGFLELGAELSGTTCVPVATSPDSENVRWMGWSLDDSAGGPMTESSCGRGGLH